MAGERREQADYDQMAERLYRNRPDLLELYYERAGIYEYDATDVFASDGKTAYPLPEQGGRMGWTSEHERRAQATRRNASMEALEYVREAVCRDQGIERR